ncbi:hypothetical protein MKQ70_00365 [Chitinophaga sedimenti]|uniref:hypothetical protein n=1 Tax=Chitinophaga sedimenti TaxID=2033606 RepID=UPI0020062669|nr:hypothetical protein [Chitinophaga sedimenti]MCK7553540.1 hypothetical protein [Chitinophaga sedimenti]
MGDRAGTYFQRRQRDFQQLKLEDGSSLYEQVMRTTASWGSPDNMMFVVGATQADSIAAIRQMLPDHFFLVPV